MKKLVLVLILTLGMTGIAYADEYGHEGVNDEDVTLEDMLIYALEDEVLAYTTYEKIVEAFDVTRPFTNIMKAELKHQALIIEMMDNYNIDLPEIDPTDHIILPTSLSTSFEAGVQAEIANIALYQSFLEKDVPEDIKEVFEYLIAGSENHLKAFEKQVIKPLNQGNGRRSRKSWF